MSFTFTDLDPYIKRQILNLLPTGEVVSLLQTNRTLKDFKNDEDLWKMLYQRDFENIDELPQGVRNWKQLYIIEYEEQYGKIIEDIELDPEYGEEDYPIEDDYDEYDDEYDDDYDLL